MLRLRSVIVGAVLAVAMTAAGGSAAGEEAGRQDGGPAPPALLRLLGVPGGPAAASPGFSSDNVEWLGVRPQHTGSSGGKLVGDYYYVTDPRGVYIYDVSTPASPELVGSLLAAQSTTHVVFAQEEPDTNGKILLVNALHPSGGGAPPANGWLLVIDVSEKSSPTVIGSLNIYDHTWTCFLNCRYAIGRTGHIVDLTDPAEPERIADWREHVFEDGYMHDFVEVARGRVIGAGQPSFYLDVRNPRRPRQLARIDSDFHTLGYHGALWPRNARDRLLLMGAEVGPQGAPPAGSDCDDESTYAVATYDATRVLRVDRKEFGPRARRGRAAGIQRQRARANFRKLREWRVDGRGVYADGKAPGNTFLYCGHWFDTHPKWRAGGVLAIAHYDWGTRFLDVRRNGRMQEIGWFQPVGGHTGAAKWINDEIVYVHDYRRGLEILRFTDG
jgi:hypothetical protein